MSPNRSYLCLCCRLSLNPSFTWLRFLTFWMKSIALALCLSLAFWKICWWNFGWVRLRNRSGFTTGFLQFSFCFRSSLVGSILRRWKGWGRLTWAVLSTNGASSNCTSLSVMDWENLSAAMMLACLKPSSFSFETFWCLARMAWQTWTNLIGPNQSST